MTTLRELATSSKCEIRGRVEWSSNSTLIVGFVTPEVDEPGEQLAVYKPEQGEQPLHDFPAGLWKREIAAYEIATALGWPAIPETFEFDGPFGIGSLQQFIDHDPNEHFFTFGERRELQDALRKIAVFDVLTNNTDRKAGHFILDRNEKMWSIDHGLLFNSSPRLRTVLWKFADETASDQLLADITRVAEQPPETLSSHLSDEDFGSLLDRMRAFLAAPHLPALSSNRQLPWPLV